MARVTITIGKDSLRRAGPSARAEGTSGGAAAREFLERHVRSDSVPESAVVGRSRLARTSRAPAGQRTRDRDARHER